MVQRLLVQALLTNTQANDYHGAMPPMDFTIQD